MLGAHAPPSRPPHPRSPQAGRDRARGAGLPAPAPLSARLAAARSHLGPRCGAAPGALWEPRPLRERGFSCPHLMARRRAAVITASRRRLWPEDVTLSANKIFIYSHAHFRSLISLIVEAVLS